MAKGFIEHSTLAAIADAIRAKTKNTDSMLPSDMAAMIEGVSTAHSGAFTTASGGGGSVNSLGRSLPIYNSYDFIMIGQNSAANMEFGFVKCRDGEIVQNTRYEKDGNSYAGGWVIDFANGTITAAANFYVNKGEIYDWFYIPFEEVTT